MLPRQWRAIALVTATCGCGSIPCAGAAAPDAAPGRTAPLALDLFAGWGGLAVSGDWIPLRAEIHTAAGTPAGQGRLEAIQAQTDCGSALAIAWAGETHLVRELPVPMGAGGSWHITCQLLQDGARDPVATARAQVRVLAPETRLVVAAGAPLPGFRGGVTEGEGGESSAVVMVEPRELPRLALAWEGVRVLRLAEAAAAALDPEQMAAVSCWVAAGGQLIVEPGPGGAVLAAVLAELGLAPALVTAEGVRREQVVVTADAGADASLAAGGGWVYPGAGAGGQGVAGSLRYRTEMEEWSPLWTDHRVGLGVVRVWNVIPDEWRGTGLRAAWSACAGISPPPPIEEGDVEVGETGAAWKPAEQMRWLLAVGRARRIRLGFVAAIAIAYVLLVGVVDYRLVRWLRRPVLTWVTFPIWTAAVVGAAIALGYRVHSGRPVVRGVTLLTALDAERGLADVTAYRLCEPQWGARYRLASASGILRPAAVDASGGWSPSRTWFGAGGGVGTAWEGRLERWNPRLFLERAIGPAAVPLRATWTDPAGAVLALELRRGWRALDLAVVRGEEAWTAAADLPRAAAGGERAWAVDLARPSDASLAGHLETGAGALAQAIRLQYGGSDPPEPVSARELGIAAQMLWFPTRLSEVGVHAMYGNEWAVASSPLEEALRRGCVLVLGVLEREEGQEDGAGFAWSDASGRQLAVTDVLACAVVLWPAPMGGH